MKRSIFVLLLIYIGNLSAQNTITLSGKVICSNDGDPIPSATVAIRNTTIGEFTDEAGRFELCHLKKDTYTLIVSAIGYKVDTLQLELQANKDLTITLQTAAVSLNEIVIHNTGKSGAYASIGNSNRSLAVEMATTNFSKLIANLPGVNTIDIGANLSKPVVRGLGFNRIAVINRGITVQDQQWGVDHGLDINIFDLNQVNVYKGANSLMYGSDAVAGAVEILPPPPSLKNGIAGEVNTWAASNNNLFGGALLLKYRKDKWYGRATASYENFADYRVPADSFVYLSYPLKIYDRRLKNTAGRNYNVSATMGYWTEKLKIAFNISNNYNKNGFFSGAHGFPDGSKLLPDGSTRNIDFPYTTANHLTVTNNVDWRIDRMRLAINTGFQDDHRQEYSLFHSHYSYATPPAVNPNLELDFRLRTYSSNAKLYIDEDNDWRKVIGASIEYQQNRVGGYSFFLPRFDQIAGGLFFNNTYYFSKELYATGGLRYDLGHINITGFYDQTLDNELRGQGLSQEQAEAYANRAYDVKRDFGNLSGAVGIVYKPRNEKEWYATLGKSFRFPTAVELAANGIHHAAFRHEIGNPDLNAEQGYSLDVGFKYYKYRQFRIEVTPFVNYFSNFIYLQPTKEFSFLPDAGQKYKYEQNKALIAGGEVFIQYRPISHVTIRSTAEYVYNQNLDTHYALPFTPPFMLKTELGYESDDRSNKAIRNYRFGVYHHLFAAQNRIAQAEEITPGANLFGASLGTDFMLSPNFKIETSLQADNIFNTAYLNHLSFYRKLNIPEPGRNIKLFVRIPF